MSAVLERKFSTASIEDTSYPWNLPLRAKYARGFAYTTIKDRLPVILTKVIDGLSRDKESITQEYGEGGKEDTKKVVGCLSQLKNEMITNKEFKLLEFGPDASIWNNYLQSKVQSRELVTWFRTEWLYAECYMYRRITEAFLSSTTLKNYDPFRQQKLDCLNDSLDSTEILANYLIKLTADAHSQETLDLSFQRMLKNALWANRVDLSMSSGEHVEIHSDPLKLVDELDNLLLHNSSKEVLEYLKKSANNNVIIDIVHDNAGLEHLTDLCLAEFLMSVYKPAHIRFHCKAIPWFISDVMESDFHTALDKLANHKPACKHLASKCKGYLEQGQWSVHSEIFWTLPFGYNEMKTRDPKLYSKLSESSLVIFKGDLNYRKLLGDVNWEYNTALHNALQGFNPAPIVTLRTAKADLIAGLDPSVYEPIMGKDPNWLITGEYGLIQFDDSISKI